MFVSYEFSVSPMDNNFIVSARKYRPSTFRTVVGQGALTTTLKNAIAGNKLAHAYLFSGPRGVGKTTCARIFAKTINCLNPTPEHEACNECESCTAFNEQRSYNIHELDAASNNGVDDIRSLIEQVRVPPQIGKYKVYIIDEVHMLSQAAFNSFLKTLEEPPAHAIFILATTEKHKIIPTILSRCQVYDFNRIRIDDIVEHLQYVAAQEGVKAEPEALTVIAQKADGGMRDALSIFDQTVSFTEGNITYRAVIENLNVLDYEYYFKLSEAILWGSVTDCLLILNDILNRGFEGQYIISGIASHFRDLLVCKDAQTASLFEVGRSIRNRYVETAQRCSNEFLYRAIETANDCDLNYRLSKNKRLLLELTLIRLCQSTGNTPPGRTKKQPTIQPIKNDTQRNSATNAPQSTNPERTTHHRQPSEVAGQTVSSHPTARTEDKTAEAPHYESVRETATSQQTTVPVTTTSPPQSNKEGKRQTFGEPSKVSEEEISSLPKKEREHAPAEKKQPSLSGMGVSLASLKKREREKNAVAESREHSSGKNNRFTEQELVSAWDEYEKGLEKERLLKNTMRLYHPKMTGEHQFEVEVNTELNEQYLNDNSQSILAFLREKLGNDHLSMTIKIGKENMIKQPLTPREIFDEMVRENPSLQKLSDEFGLELG